MWRPPTTLAAIGLSACTLAACGGDDSAPIDPITTTAGESTSTSEISAAELASRADPLCVEANFAIAGLEQTIAAGDLATAASQEQEITEGVLSGIEALPDPVQAGGPLRRYKAALDRQVEILSQREDAARGGDTAAYEMLGGELAQAKADARIAAEEFGFEDCGQEGSAPVDGSSSGGGGSTEATPPAPPTGGATPPPTATPAPAPAPAPAAPAPPPDSGGAAPESGTGGGGGGGSGGSSGGIGPG